MKLIKPSFNIIEQQSGLEGMYKQIEIAGRTCYKSEDKITETSAKDFVDRMIKSGHGAMLEHGTVYLMIHTIAPEDWDKKIARHHLITIDDSRDYLRTNPTCNSKGEENWWAKEARHIAHKMVVKYADNQYSKVKIVTTEHEVNTEGGVIITPTGEMPMVTKGLGKIISVFNTILITTNLRVLVENNWLDDLKYVCEPTEYHEKRITVRYTSDIHFYKDTTRHRVFSWAIESTRFCNYLKEKFSSSISFLIPCWIKPEEQEEFEEDLKTIENIYFKWINKGWQAQQAAYFLIQGTKAEIIMTGYISDYKHFFDLRSELAITGKPHPVVMELVEPLRQEFIKRNLL